ncbi:hypothetical protein FIBSPDRAFT_847345 [Athelia psychrophila]|uniref:RlpA-like protein double-psi beta-barrel domain-containing protein n=1 Tax=Athelia psychrophila TaxID=1759441 RepID=A0A166W687_9AGAM|nr:hypothetical protein FIBSPDRAFT_847345 [Fibularhizoctonia sp. CBS 109695]
MLRFAVSLLCVCAFFFITLAAPVPDLAGLGELIKRTPYYTTSTYFYVGQGACGSWSKDSDHIVALGANHYGTGAHCGQYIYVENTSTHQSVYAKILDECESCTGSDRIDLSPSAFTEIGEMSTGVLDVVWHFMPEGWSP